MHMDEEEWLYRVMNKDDEFYMGPEDEDDEDEYVDEEE